MSSRLLRPLGRGITLWTWFLYLRVKLAEDSKGQLVATKRYNFQTSDLQTLIDELTIIKNLSQEISSSLSLSETWPHTSEKRGAYTNVLPSFLSTAEVDNCSITYTTPASSHKKSPVLISTKWCPACTTYMKRDTLIEISSPKICCSVWTSS